MHPFLPQKEIYFVHPGPWCATEINYKKISSLQVLSRFWGPPRPPPPARDNGQWVVRGGGGVGVTALSPSASETGHKGGKSGSKERRIAGQGMVGDRCWPALFLTSTAEEIILSFWAKDSRSFRRGPHDFVALSSARGFSFSAHASRPP